MGNFAWKWDIKYIGFSNYCIIKLRPSKRHSDTKVDYANPANLMMFMIETNTILANNRQILLSSEPNVVWIKY